MEYSRLYDSIISVTKESQIKLGYESVAFGINYVESSLLHLLGDSCTPQELPEVLAQFTAQCSDTLGDVAFTRTSSGYRLDIPATGVDYVHSLIDDNDFLVQFIGVIRNYNSTIDDIVAVFRRYSDRVTVQQIENNDEFDYLIYFDDGVPDAYWYCIDTQDIGMTYHRFVKEDYLDFGF